MQLYATSRKETLQIWHIFTIFVSFLSFLRRSLKEIGCVSEANVHDFLLNENIIRR